jgi:hypothetical protein
MATLTLRASRTRQCQVPDRDWLNDHVLNAVFPRRPGPKQAFEFLCANANGTREGSASQP